MIKLEAIEGFTLERFDELQNIQRKSIGSKGRIYVGDIFECPQDLTDYLLGANPIGRAVVKVIEVEPEKEEYEVVKVEETYRNKNNEKVIVEHEYIKPKKKKSSKK